MIVTGDEYILAMEASMICHFTYRVRAILLGAGMVSGVLIGPPQVEAAVLETITLDQVVNDWTSSLEARWRDLGDATAAERRLYLEAPTITPPPDVQAMQTAIDQSDNPFSFSFDANTSVASMSLGGGTSTNALTTATFDYTGDPDRPTGFNDLLIKLRIPNATASMTLSELTLDGMLLMPSSLTNTVGGELFWVVLDAISMDTFELTGLFSATGLTNSNEANRFEVQVGNFRVAQVPLPAALPMFVAGLVALGITTRRRRSRANA